jgi:outer membrane protein assembly factor BamB
VSVAAGRAFTLWQQGNEQRLVALDADDGRILWQRGLGPAFSSQYGDGPRSTPVLDEGRVFAIDALGHLVAARAEDGSEIWSYDLARDFGARIPSIGYASTPLVEGDHLLVEVGSKDGAFMAFDKRSGEVVWSSQSDEPAYVSPVALTARGRLQAVFFSASGLYALAPVPAQRRGARERRSWGQADRLASVRGEEWQRTTVC